MSDRVRVLITGASGLLGRAVNHVLQLHKDKYETLGLCFSRRQDGLTPCDLTNFDDTLNIISQFKPQFIVHCAAERRPDVVQKDPKRAQLINDVATEKLCEIAKTNNAVLLFISTDYVFDGKNPPYNEDSVANPLNSYGESKVKSEKVVLSSNPQNIVLRVPVLYGDIADVNESAITYLFVLVKAQVPCTVDDYQKRFPTHCEDVALTIQDMIYKACVEKDDRMKGIFHCSGTEGFTKYHIAQIMGVSFGISTDHITALVDPNDPACAIRPCNAQLSVQKLTDLGICHTRAFEDGIKLSLLKFVYTD